MSRKRRRWGRVRQLPSGRFQARYPGPDGQLYPAPHTFPTKTDADLWLVDKEAELRREGWRDPNGGRIPLGDYAEQWVKERAGLTPKTRSLYRGLLGRHIKPQLGSVELVSVTTPMVRQWRQELLDTGVGEVTVAKAYRLLKAILTTATDDDELIPRNPCRIKGAGRERSPERPVPTIVEVYRIAAEIKPWFRVLVLLAAFTGLRWGELMGLRRRHLDLTSRLVYVRTNLVEVEGKLVEGWPKSTAGIRDVAIPEAIVPELQTHLDTWSEPGRDGKVFVGPKGATPLSGNFGKLWRQALAGADVTSELHFHDLRHCANEIAADVVRNLRELMAHMGHSSERAALIYQHTKNANQAIADAISAMIEDAQGHVWGTQAENGDEDGSGEVPTEAA